MISLSRVFYINSAVRTAGTDGNFLANVPLPAEEKFTHVCVMEANIPKSYYLVQEGYNTFTLIENGVSLVISVAPGNYNVNTFARYLSNRLTALSPNLWVYSVSYSTAQDGPQTGKYTFAVVTGGVSQPTFVFTNFLQEQLGFVRNSTNVFVGGVLTSTNVVKFQLEDVLYCHSDMVGDGREDILQHFFTNGTPDNGVINYKCLNHMIMGKKICNTSGNVFRFTLTDEYGSLIDLNGQNWNLVIAAFHVNQPLMLQNSS